MIDSWYAYGTIRFTREHILWVLDNAEFFRNGKWPPEPAEYFTDVYSKELKKWVVEKRLKGTYIEAPITKRRIKAEGSFIKPSTIIAEIDLRCELCGTDGLILKALKCWDETPENLAKHFRISVEDVEARAEAALRFITGWRRKTGTYRRWNYRTS